MTRESIEQLCENPKAFMLKGKHIKSLIDVKRERVDYWRRLAESITVTLKSDGGSAPRGYKQSLVENAVCNIIAYQDELLDEIRELEKIERDIQEAINTFLKDERYKKVLELRYLGGYNWDSISEQLFYGREWVCRLHGFALRELKCEAEKSLGS